MLPFCSFSLLFLHLANTQSDGSGYTDYSLKLTGAQDSVLFETASTPSNVSTTYPQPDVYLNVSVHVGEIDINVSNLTAKVNLDAQVLNLLQFNAGVDLSIDNVSLNITNVSAHVLLEARLENLVLMINDTLNSIDLNPFIATLGQDVGTLVNTAVGGLASGSSETSTVLPRSYDLVNNILYSMNDYSGNTHTNHVLLQNGSIVDQFLDNNGNVHNLQIVGSYLSDMTFNGYNQSVTKDGQAAHELEYVYTPFNGLSVVSAIYVDVANKVLATQVLSESGAGGSSTINDQ
ncbi:MAG: hypothetical protein MMC33_006396 [Icmadophila ericetorum]|nr:hypothetical protein [Icmadophila ericetorum]